MVSTPDRIDALYAASAPWWAAEAEVFAAYWNSPARTHETDCAWLARQCHKELFDGVAPRITRITWLLDEGEGAGRGHRAELVRAATDLAEEADHYDRFAAAHDAVAELVDPALPPLTLAQCRAANWPENEALATARARHRDQDPDRAARAQAFTEGGAGTLYAAGAALSGGGPADDAIATACAAVEAGATGHMGASTTGLADQDLDDEAWHRLAGFVVEQLRLRVPMRNAQFGHPLDEVRMAEIRAGQIETANSATPGYT